jgi:DNA polymerase III delta subunit
MKIMRKITQFEKIKITNDAEDFILNVCNNTAKILINYIEKFKLLNEPITLELASNVCSNISLSTFEEYTQFLKDGQLKDAIKLLYNIYDKGYSVMDILDNYFVFVKITRLLSEEQKYNIIPFICKYITVFHNIHEDEIELALFSNNLQKIVI